MSPKRYKYMRHRAQLISCARRVFQRNSFSNLINAVIEIKDLHGTDLHNSDGISENNNQGPPIENTTPRVINPAVEVKDHDGTDRISANNTQGPDVVIPRRLYEKDGFLAGEETPVWVAKVHFNKSHHRRYRYIRLNIDGTPMVKESLDNWNQLKEGGGFPIRKMSSKDHFSYAMSIADISRDTAVYEKRSADSNEVVYPSVLLVMDYEADPLSIDDLVIKRWTPEQLVTYALAFWGTVDSSLRNIQNPRVSLRIAGIVITKSRAATPYLRYDQNENTIVEALTPMIDYWRSVSKGNNSDFPIGSYDIVVHMTDMCPWYNYRTCKDCTECTLSSRQHHPSLAAASEGPPCKLKDQIGGVIMYDDLAFNGLHRAIAQISKVLGGSDETPWVYGYPRRKWTKKLLNTLSNALKDTSCMAAPKQLFRAGTPVPPILAGEFMPNEKQCELAGYEPDAWACWDTSYESGRSNCYFLKCSNQHIWGVTCSQVGPTLDGSFCNAKNTKICLDGQCVDKY